MRYTGFIALVVIAVAAFTIIFITNTRNTIPEPHASCIEAWRNTPDNPLLAFGSVDLKLEDHAQVHSVSGANERIVTAVGPVARAAGRPITLHCERQGDGPISALESN